MQKDYAPRRNLEEMQYPPPDSFGPETYGGLR